MYTHTHVPGWIGPLPLSSSSTVTEEVSRCQCASSDAGQHHCCVATRHHAGERGRHVYVILVIT